jgi:hypothetical protein
MPSKPPERKPAFRCGRGFADVVTGKELKRETALCQIVNEWNPRKIATLVLSPQGAARGYLALWIGFIYSMGMDDDLFTDVPNPTNEEEQEEARVQLTRNLAAIILRLRKISMDKSKQGHSAAKKKFDETLWGEVGKVVVKGEVERVMRIWPEVEKAWREMTGTQTPDLTPDQYTEVAELGLSFAHSNETAVEAA